VNVVAATRSWPQACGTTQPLQRLQRHALVWLQPQAWQAILARPALDALDLACLAHWAEHDLPLVVTRQPAGSGDTWQLGLSAPLAWSRRRLFLSASAADMARFGDFPHAEQIDLTGDALLRDWWQSLCAGLAEAGAPVRVFGSRGWQAVSGLVHAGAESDIDLLMRVDSPNRADAVTGLLEQAQSTSPSKAPRIDGELVFEGGAATAWREWAAWRRSGRGTILVKRLRTTTLESGLESFG
jgi:phosphoribosyl-dephospho-CoA transferase